MRKIPALIATFEMNDCISLTQTVAETISNLSFLIPNRLSTIAQYNGENATPASPSVTHPSITNDPKWIGPENITFYEYQPQSK